ncbi:hypothetical protein MIMGU_mgv1a022976mg, partial [Erythranthe guttata]
ELDSNGNGSLDFWEVLTLYYIVKSGRPLCGILVTGTFFSCVECFDSPTGAYSLCIYCYRSNKSDHNHVNSSNKITSSIFKEVSYKVPFMYNTKY